MSLFTPVVPEVGTAVGPGARPADTAPRPGPRVLLAVAGVPVVAGYGIVVVLVATALVLSGVPDPFDATAHAASAVWLAGYLVPIVINGAPLGVLPMLPTVLLMAVIARTTGGLAGRLGLAHALDGLRVIGLVAGSHAVLGAVVAVLGPMPAVTARPWQAALGCAVVPTAAAACGLSRRCRFVPVVCQLVPGWLAHGLRCAALGLAALLTAGATAVLTGLVIAVPTIHELLLQGGNGGGSWVGLTVVSICYLPNAVVAGASWLAGTGVSIGAVTVTPLGTAAGPVPAVPLLAALPNGPVPGWLAGVSAVPVLIGVVVGNRCATVEVNPVRRLRSVAVAVVVIAIGCLLLATVAGGRLGGGVYDPVRVPGWWFALAVLAWTALPAVLAAWAPGWRERRRVARTAVAEPADPGRDEAETSRNDGHSRNDGGSGTRDSDASAEEPDAGADTSEETNPDPPADGTADRD